MKDETLNAVILIVGTSAAVYSAFCGSYFAAAEHEPDADTCHRMRLGEGLGTFVTVALGIVASAHVGDSVPLWVSLGMVALFVSGFEYASAHTGTNNATTPVSTISANNAIVRR
ncbi:hypothetical protein HUO13_26120 [Saccharopolyspora erythraea]|uniref:hypothetical protein n=1 Tax=Saccharopolyspora erythraea TaxID=1836 RepID=UPI001BAB4F60|nr:hypothetical protein [Saccharopolyspora erythraea]QUH03828.1 hypothetical protein HUO13_26120 [Saccharopolyspora erythraea]